MDEILLLRLLVSFLAGGTLVTFLAVVGEKLGPDFSGIFLTFPSTLVLGFFFLGWTTGAESVAMVVPSTLIPLGIVVLSSALYVHAAILSELIFPTKKLQILLTISLSLLVWFMLVSPFAVYRPNSLFGGISGYFLAAGIANFLLRRPGPAIALQRPSYTRTQLLVRALFTGCVIAMVVFLSKTLSPFWGGIFTMFPAAIFSSLVILQFYFGGAQLFYFVKNVPLGSVSLLVYSLSVMVLFPRFGIWAGTGLSYALSLAAGMVVVNVLMWFQKKDRKAEAVSLTEQQIK